MNIPGKIVESQDELIEAILEEDYETEKIQPFADKFFDKKDGHATDRIIKLFYNIMEH